MNLKKKLSMLLSSVSPRWNSRILYRMLLHRKLDLEHPKRFSEKLMYLKLNEYDGNELISRCCDKYAVRQYIEEQGYGDILCQLYGAYDDADDIDFDQLPDRFVLKCNHGCAYNILCPDKSKLDIAKTRKQLNDWLKEDYWKVFSELNYRMIEKKIICEEYLEDQSGELLDDYKFYCFNGTAKYVMLCAKDKENVRRFYFFDRDWKMQPFTSDGLSYPEIEVEKPEKIDEMFDIAQDLSKPFKFVRVDLYLVNGRIYFGELTFTPSACLDRKRLESTDELFGEYLEI